MFIQLIRTLTSGDVLDRAFAEFAEMLEHANWMFARANEVISHQVAPKDARESLYQRDQSINKLLKGIRRKIVRHLTINPGGDVAACLALMSVAKDAERIGDYCKNVFEVGQFYTEAFNVPKYHEPIDEIRASVESLFTSVQECWKESDIDKAKQAIGFAGDLRKRCDQLIEELLGDEASMETHEAVAYALLARHFKRVAGHLANITTAIFGNIEDLDFHR